MIPSAPSDPSPSTREPTESDILRFHYTLLSIASAPASASPTFLPPPPPAQLSTSSTTPSKGEVYNSCPTCSNGISAINPALLALRPSEGVRTSSGFTAEESGKGKKRARNSDSTPIPYKDVNGESSSKKQTILARESISGTPSSSTTLPLIGTPIPMSTLLARFRAQSGSSTLPPKSILPQCLQVGGQHVPFTPRTAVGMEMDELNTPFQPVLFGKASQQQQTQVGTPVGAGMDGIGVGGRMHPGWAVGTPAGRKG